MRTIQLLMMAIAILCGFLYELFVDCFFEEALYYDWDKSIMKYVSDMVGCFYLIAWFSFKYKRKIIIYRSFLQDDLIINNENFDLENEISDQNIKSKLFSLKIKINDLSKINDILYFK